MAMRAQGGRPVDPNHYEQVIQIKRVSKKTKGGNLVTFAALVVTGDKQGKVGIGLGKAPTVSDAIKKAVRLANRDGVNIPVVGGTVPYQVTEKYGAAKVLLKPARKGTGIIAGGAVRAIVEAAGITDIVSKMFGTANKLTNAYATFRALKSVEVLAAKHKYLKEYQKSSLSSCKGAVIPVLSPVIPAKAGIHPLSSRAKSRDLTK